MFGNSLNWCRALNFRWLTLCGLCGLLVLLATGCGTSYRWRADFQKAEDDARAQGKTLFIFYKWFWDPTSNRMLSHEFLYDPLVSAEFRDTINVLIDREYGPSYTSYVRRFKVHSYPAFILVSPDGKYRPLTGAISRDQFLEWVRDFKSRTSQPAPPAFKPGGK